VKRRKTITRFSSGEESNRDPGKIQSEQGAHDKEAPNRLQAADNEDILPRRYATRKQKPQSSSVISVDSSSSEEDMTSGNRPTRFKQSHYHVVVSDESESQQPRKWHRLVKGRRPEDSTLEDAENDDESLIDEVDEDSSCHSGYFFH